MATKKNRLMIVLSNEDMVLLEKIKSLLGTKQSSKAISFLLRLYLNNINKDNK